MFPLMQIMFLVRIIWYLIDDKIRRFSKCASTVMKKYQVDIEVNVALQTEVWRVVKDPDLVADP